MVALSGKYLWGAVVLAGLLTVPLCGTAQEYEEIFSDNFDSYPADTLLSSGNVDSWTVPTDASHNAYDGNGAINQKVENTAAVSQPNSLQLQGARAWASNAFRQIDIPWMVRVEGKVMVDASSDCSTDQDATNILALIGLYNPDVGIWGQEYGEVHFNCDNKLYAVKKHPSESVYEYVELLNNYSRNTWYSVVLDINRRAKTYTVTVSWDNGSVVERDISFEADTNYQPTGIRLGAIHGGNGSTAFPWAWFDDIKVSGYDPNPWPMFVVPATQKDR